MLDICLLGCGGMMPLPKRHLTSLMARCNGKNILIDCGEGTQIAIRKIGWSFKQIDVICFTHFHGDHIGGLPGLLLTMSNSDRIEPLTLVGPKGLKKVVESLLVIAPGLPFMLNYIELAEPEVSLWFGDYRIEAFKVDHRVVCYGYNIELDRAGKFDPVKAKDLGLPVNYWGMLQKGEIVEYEGNTYTSDMVMGPPRKGIKVTYCTDTRPVDIIGQYAEDADLFICEGMYGDKEKQQDAIEKKHMTFYEAAEIGKKANVKRMWLTHYSPSLVWPGEYMDDVHKICEFTEAGKDLKNITLKFDED